MKCYLLDACAIIAFLNDEAGADKVQWLLDDLAAAVYMNCIFVTADHHELDALEQNESIQFYWIR